METEGSSRPDVLGISVINLLPKRVNEMCRYWFSL